MSVPTPPALGGSRRRLAVDGVTRRSLLQLAARGVVGTGLVLSVAGCGLRLDLPAPEPPVPTRKQAPDEALLVSVIGDLSQIVAAEKALLSDPSAVRTAGTRSTLSTLLRLQREQVTVLTGRLTNDGVPLAAITARPTAGSGIRSVGELAARLDSLGDSDWAAVASATASARELLTSAYSLRLAGAALLGRAVAMPTAASPAREALITRTRPLVYAFEVVAAQSAGAQRSRAVATLDRVTSLEEEVAAGSTTVPTGWSLPFPVTTPAAASRLATHVFSAAIASLVDVAGPSPTAASLRDSARWSARVQSLAIDWSVPLTPFPGTNE
ncbi:MAG: ferritin-like domain-containing protein [Humibacillus sp.]|nr:ferritin-like domain-containing protein [Humibacillus sp.]MDN5775513.1 ferritin-like domain-containing protein [Humibacillus sp.]